MRLTEIGLIVPTLGNRPILLRECLRSIRRSAQAHISVVIPRNSPLDESLRQFCDTVVIDPGKGLAAAINAAARALPSDIEYLNWLGDDDVLMGDGHRQLVNALRHDPRTVLAYGYCSYLNMAGDTMFQVRPGRWAEKLLHFGPQLISQPAVLFRRDAFERVGGLDESLRWAFDLELFIKLSRVGQFAGVSVPTAGYRWHTAALTVGQRSGSVREASLVRRRNLPPVFRLLAWVWEPFVRWSILFAGDVVSRRAVTQRAHDS